MRLEILERIHGRTISAPDLVREIPRATLGVLDYHLEVLVKLGFLERVQLANDFGYPAYLYRSVPTASIGWTAWEKLPQSLQSSVVGSGLEEFLDHAAAALESDTIGRSRGNTANWMVMDVDPTGWTQVTDLMGKSRDQLVKIQEQCRLRQGNRRPIVVGLAAFESPARFPDEIAP
jgi:hypothetical protein